MSKLAPNEIFDIFNATYPGRVHQQHHVPFGGAAGHIYFVLTCPTYQQLAQITPRSRNAEVGCYRINDAYILTIGNTGVASGRVIVPDESGRRAGIEEVEWIAHTHPLEQRSHDEAIAEGAGRADRAGLRRLTSLWRQERSVVVVCRGGRVVRDGIKEFTGVDWPSERSPDGRLWTPEPPG